MDNDEAYRKKPRGRKSFSLFLAISYEIMYVFTLYISDGYDIISAQPKHTQPTYKHMNTSYTRLALGLDGVIVDLDNTSNDVENLFTILDGDIVHRMHITGKITQGRRSKQFSFDLLFRSSSLNDFASAPAKATALVNESLRWTLRKVRDMSWFARLGYTALENAYHDMEYTIRVTNKCTLDSVNSFRETIAPIASED